MLAVLLLMAMPFNQAEFDNFIENNQTVLVSKGPVPELKHPVARLMIRRFRVIEMSKPAGPGPVVGIYNKKVSVFIYKGSMDVK